MKVRVLPALTALAILGLVAGGTARADVLYQVDNGTFESAMNTSDTSEARDNWMGNTFTVQAGGETITKAYFQAGDYGGYTATLGIYTDNGDATAPQAATLVHSQDFTIAANSLNEIVLTAPVVLTAGDKMVVGVLVAGVPGDKYPYAIGTNTDLGRSYWDRDFSTAKGDPENYPMVIGDLSKAVGTNQGLIPPPGWVPSDNGCNTAGIRALGVPEPATLSLVGVGLLALIRRRK